MRASLISPRPTSTSDAAKPSCLKEKGSNDRPSRTDACNTTPTPHNINQQMRQILHSISPPKVPNYLTTDSRDGQPLEPQGTRRPSHDPGRWREVDVPAALQPRLQSDREGVRQAQGRS